MRVNRKVPKNMVIYLLKYMSIIYISNGNTLKWSTWDIKEHIERKKMLNIGDTYSHFVLMYM